MSDLINDIRRAQVRAGEQAVIDRLNELGLGEDKAQKTSHEEYTKHAKSLAKPLLELLEQCVIKQHVAIIEEIHDQIKKRDARIDKLEHTLKTCITWQAREFGDAGVRQLLTMLDTET